MKAIKTLTAAALLLSAGLATTAAQASDVRWSVHIGLPLPVVTLPAPVVTVPAPVYRHAPVQAPPAWRDRDRDGIADWRDPYDNRRVGPGWRDRDRDGIADWRDPHDNRRGHAHRHDRDRDRDGVPDWRDHRDNRWDKRWDDRRDDWRDDRRGGR